MSFAPITSAECAKKIAAARRIAVLTGAGMSTAAGVPDFRGPRGLYVTRAYDPETVFEISYFDRDPKPFYQFSRDFLGLIAGISPTYAHEFLASLEKRKPGMGVITQNIDGLHQRAGSKQVYPMHGDYETAHCRKCGKAVSGTALRALMDSMETPACAVCDGTIKPDVVFFGEAVRCLAEAERLAAESDLMLVLGSSLTVYPAAALPYQAGGEVVIVNQGPVGMRAGKGVYLADAGLDEFFRGVAAGLEME